MGRSSSRCVAGGRKYVFGRSGRARIVRVNGACDRDRETRNANLLSGVDAFQDGMVWLPRTLDGDGEHFTPLFFTVTVRNGSSE